MPRQKHFDIKPTQIQVSDRAKKYFVSRKLEHKEPMYSVVDRCISEFKLRDIAALIEENANLRKCINGYIERNELEKQTKQTTLI